MPGEWYNASTAPWMQASNAYSNEPTKVQQNLNYLYKTNPAAFQDPSLVHSFATSNHTDPRAAAQSLKYLALYNDATTGLYAKMNRNGASATLWGGLLNGLHKAWGAAANQISGLPTTVESIGRAIGRTAGGVYGNWQNDVTNAVKSASSPTIGAGSNGSTKVDFAPVANKTGGMFQGLSHGVWDDLKSVNDWLNTIANRTGVTAGELAGAHGLSGYQDAYNTLNNIATSSANLVNPFSKDNGYQLMAHTIAYYESLAKQKGGAYALGHALPSLLAIIASDGAAADATIPDVADGVDMSAAAQKADEKVIMDYTTRYGNDATKPGFEEARQAHLRVNYRKKVYELQPGFEDSALDNIDGVGVANNKALKLAKAKAEQNSIRNVVSRVVNRISPTGPITSMARALGTNVSSIRLNAMYILNQEAAKLENKDLWDKTAGGQVIDQYGHATDLGQQTMEWLGLNKGSLFYDMSSGIMDVYTKYLGTDPLGAMGKTWSLAHSTAGLSPKTAKILGSLNESIKDFTNRLSLSGRAPEIANRTLTNASRIVGNTEIFFRGLGIHSADDVELTKFVPNVYDAYNFMAEHNAGEIADRLRNTYGIETLRKLGDAKSFDEVVQIHKYLADGYGLLKAKAPTLGMYSWAKTIIRDAAIERAFRAMGKEPTIQSMAGLDYAVIDHMVNQMESKTYDLRSPSALYRSEADVSLRIRTTFRQWAYRQLSRKPMYWSDLTKQIEHARIIPGDMNSIPAIMDMARSAMMPEEVVSAMGEFLMHSQSTEDFVNAYNQCLYHIIMRRAVAGLKEAELSSLSKDIEDHIWSEVTRLGNSSDVGSLATAYTPGASSTSVDSNFGNMITIDERKFNSAVGTTQLNVLNLPRARDLNNIADFVRKTVRDLTPIEHDPFTETLTQEQIKSLADSGLGSISSAVRHAKMVKNIRKLDYENVIGASKKSEHFFGPVYENVHKEIENVLKTIQSDRGFRVEGGISTTDSLNIKKYLLDSETGKPLVGNHLERSYAFIADSYKVELEKADKMMSLLQQHELLRSNPEAADLFGVLEPAPSTSVVNEQLARMYAYRDYMSSMNMTFDTTAAFNLKQAKDWAKENANSYRIEDRSTEKLRQEYMKRYYETSATRRRLRSNTQYVTDGLNKTLSLVFVPLALLSGKWAFHVGISETALNSFRIGGFNFLDAAVARSLAKHEMLHGGSFLSGDFKTGNDSKDLVSEINRVLSKDVKEMFSPDTWKLGSSNLVRHSWKITRDIVAGTLMGIEKSILDSMPADERERLVENAATVMLRHPGSTHPGAVHSGDDLVFDPWSHTAGVPETTTVISPTGKEIKQKVFRSDAFAYSNKLDGLGGYGSALTEHLTRINNDKILLPIAQRLHDIISSDYELAGATGSDVWKNDIVDLLAKRADKAYMDLSPSERSRFKTLEGVFEEEGLSAWKAADRTAMRKNGPDFVEFKQTKTNIERFRDAAKEDNAKRAALSVFHSFFGRRNGKWVLQDKLLEQAVSGDILQGADQANIVREMGISAPSNIPAQGFRSADWLANGSWTKLIQRVSDYGHDKVLGPIINFMVRDPLFIYEYHQQMELLRPLVRYYFIHDYQAEVIAESRAAVEMAKFVHNPKDKTIFEENMRVLAPFYFAKNQAWRRSFRMLGDDPGAFERYLKMCLSVTDYIGTHQNMGGVAGLSIPGTEFMGWLGPHSPFLGSSMGFSNLLFGLTGSTGSVASMIPTGSESGALGVLGEVIRPAWGPLVSIPLKLLRDYTGLGTSNLYRRVITGVLGNVAAQSSVMDDIMPNSLVTGTWQVISGQMGLANGTVASITNEVMNNALDNAMQIERSKLEAMVNWKGVSASDKNFYLNGLSHWAISQKMTMDHQWYQALLENAKATAETMLAIKVGLNFFSPFALSLNAEFSKQPEFDALSKERYTSGPNKGQLKYPTYMEQMNEFSTRFPNHVLDLTAHTKPTAGDFPEVQQVVSLLDNHPGFVKEFPYASAMLANRQSKYSPQAYQLEMMLNLREREAPQEYLDSLRVALGNDLYYNFLKPMVLNDNQYAYDATDAFGKPTRKLNYQGLSKLKDLAHMYGKMDNPTWYALAGPSGSISKQSLAYQTWEQMPAMLNSKNATMISPDDKTKFEALIEIYKTKAAEMLAYKNAGDNSSYYTARDNWYNLCTQLAASKEFAAQQYFITSVLMKYPTL